MTTYHPSGAIAMFIASALQHPNPECNGRQRRISTIKVDQHKNKFDQVVVYCTLAHPDLVDTACDRERGEDCEPTTEFVKKCMFHDAVHYRKCYMQMLQLVPQHRGMILSRPDYGYLLCDKKEDIAACLGVDHAELVAKKWHLETTDELFSELHRVYDSTFL